MAQRIIIRLAMSLLAPTPSLVRLMTTTLSLKWMTVKTNGSMKVSHPQSIMVKPMRIIR
uniref:Uncharacterized protein n=1 Tax=Brassica oleracea TaxID=3712 RepID=A0A3P6FN64_BRAOL|nr:unnamed protein product [Brassica oleracea]